MLRATLLLLAAAATLTFAPAAQAAPRGPNLGTMAGYVSDGAPVNSVSATFTVPRIRTGSPADSFAGTWIGAQAPGVNGPFIQIGVNELHRFLGSHANFYYAFWSDTRLHYHPLPLFPVRAGDVIAVSLRRTHGGWRLAIVDATTRTVNRFHTRDEAHGDFNFAEVLQEDVENEIKHVPFPYPRLTKVAFRNLLVDSVPPARRRHAVFRSQWMTTSRGDLGPTKLAHDGFSLRREHLGTAAATYLGIAEPRDAAANIFYAAEARWTASTPRAQIAAESALYAAALRSGYQAFARAHWPSRLLPYIHALLAKIRADAAVVAAAPQQATADLGAWRASEVRAGRALSAAGYQVRIRMHAPSI
ncbi:MAG TPA: G1 family glutamic endopeptidase [Solirubrobacteraceae bacterium]|nr:G1 family glutamic endopeptidase [Solirubrobacteraceae bacterium]